MSALSIAIPEKMRQFVEAQAAEGGFSDPSEYVQALILADQRKPTTLNVEQALLDSLREAPTPMTPQDWEDIRQEVHQRLGQERPS
jgi:antitoxin ParD1/3/4